MGSEIARTVCSCGRKLIVWPFTSVLTVDGSVEWGETYAALVCETCDDVRRFPRFGKLDS